MDHIRDIYTTMCRRQSKETGRDVTLTVQHADRSVERIVFRDGEFYGASRVCDDPTWSATADEYSID